MSWEKPEPDRYFWRSPIEVGAATVGELFLFANPNLPRAWFFKLSLRDEEVYRWMFGRYRRGTATRLDALMIFHGRSEK